MSESENESTENGESVSETTVEQHGEHTQAVAENGQTRDGNAEGANAVNEPLTDEDATTALKNHVEALKKENAELQDQVLRRAADFDNYRKRMIKEKQDAFDYANENLLRDLLESLDNFDRTVAAADQAKDAKSIADGVKMINSALVKMLEEKYNLSSYGAAGDPFDPDEHEAIGSMQGEVAEPVLKEVYLKGYKLKDRIIRHAKVMVMMPDGSAESDRAAQEGSSEAQ
ncbi:MAG: nucleotide exchange factor GrpE [Treponema sp.]|nr:nucleotide exchange factor GrpE [Treponema sp.]